MQLDIFPDQAQLRREDPSQNMRHFYRMVIQPDLFGGASLIREWGRIGTRGRQMIDTYPDEGMAVTALMALATEKRRRGYAL